MSVLARFRGYGILAAAAGLLAGQAGPFECQAIAALFAFSAVTAYADKIDFSKVKCMVSGAAAKEAKSSAWKDGNVYFCCDNCKGKVAEAKGDEQAKLVFSDAAFEKAGFKVGK